MAVFTDRKTLLIYARSYSGLARVLGVTSRDDLLIQTSNPLLVLHDRFGPEIAGAVEDIVRALVKAAPPETFDLSVLARAGLGAREGVWKQLDPTETVFVIDRLGRRRAFRVADIDLIAEQRGTDEGVIADRVDGHWVLR